MRVFDLEIKLLKHTIETPNYSIEIYIQKDLEPIVLVNSTNYPLDKFKLLQSQLRDKNINIFDISVHIED